MSGAVGLYSKPEHPVFYYVGGESAIGEPSTPNIDLDYTKAIHSVLGYEVRLSPDLRISAENVILLFAYFPFLATKQVTLKLAAENSIVGFTFKSGVFGIKY